MPVSHLRSQDADACKQERCGLGDEQEVRRRETGVLKICGWKAQQFCWRHIPIARRIVMDQSGIQECNRRLQQQVVGIYQRVYVWSRISRAQ